jgi:hypothetical protein
LKIRTDFDVTRIRNSHTPWNTLPRTVERLLL